MRKWFGIIMNINSKKITNKFDKDIEVMNIKINNTNINKVADYLSNLNVIITLPIFRHSERLLLCFSRGNS